MNVSGNEVDVAGAVRSFLGDLAKGIITGGAAFSIIGSAVWFVARPYIDGYFDGRDEAQSAAADMRVNALRSEVLGALDSRFENLRAQIELNNRDLRPILRFNGSPQIVPRPEPYRPGDTISIGYSLQRTQACPTDVEVAFVSAELQRADTSLTYSISATRAPITSRFHWFVIDVRLPEAMEPGWYSYQPIAQPVNCEGASAAVVVPPTAFFEVADD